MWKNIESGEVALGADVVAPPRRAKLVLLVLAVALVGLGVWAWVDEGPLWRWMMTTRRYRESSRESELVRGWSTIHRWSGINVGPFADYFVRSGKRSSYGSESDDGIYKHTSWKFDGSVSWQISYNVRIPPGDREKGLNYLPPWLWGVTDQTEPTMPEWMKEDEKWAKAFEEQR